MHFFTVSHSSCSFFYVQQVLPPSREVNAGAAKKEKKHSTPPPKKKNLTPSEKKTDGPWRGLIPGFLRKLQYPATKGDRASLDGCVWGGGGGGSGKTRKDPGLKDRLPEFYRQESGGSTPVALESEVVSGTETPRSAVEFALRPVEAETSEGKGGLECCFGS